MIANLLLDFEDDLGWFSVFMLIGVLFLPTTNWLHKLHQMHADVSTAGLQSSSGQTSMQYKTSRNVGI